ncbi:MULTISPECIES: pyridoxal phosphate-dependent aminotransferase [Mycobacterium]|uniref:Aminotransferase n=1 Tax=Mycobacterium kiyosense TaxID=2871094 RepID=A0A9P3Q882_9MYCO|nr:MULTISPECIES: aminotransferase class I/II-fold pyridoxal phosphate-dependent enzyme [Mycobacterium]BDB40249.1 putative phenylalanine aminotransferase [Mycobacterium kiyosense]BDE12072.1 putative phenylalanine aminotransferase [Mycobacterium sp. 20KCMC460]GLB83712.1 putative phenylalanine aminotransferase [Mycobacterium kiyosense]GLB88774.1 putative phenylalanine aminotransferase [Mycobacterium kiyosense]GLB96367.1 putative phenylalanine aminotransferase [Mycobacterium kiyosense]
MRIDFDLSRNELPFDPLPQVRSILESSADRIRCYPEDECVMQLTAQIGELHGVPQDRVVVGPGSVGVLDAVLHAEAKGATVFGTPTFDEYASLVSRAGGLPVGAVSDPPGGQSLEAILARVDESTRQVIIATPHNPSGAAVTVDELVEFRRLLPKPVLLVVDQAYAEFDETLPDGAVRRLVTDMDGVVVLRSFSKAYGLAGLRIGFGVFSSGALAARVRAAVPTYAVNSVGITAATESLRHQRQLRERVTRVIGSRKRLEAFLLRHGLFSGVVSQGNFVWVPTPDSHALAQQVLADGILVREYPGLGVRITVQSEASVDAVIGSLTTHSRVNA